MAATLLFATSFESFADAETVEIPAAFHPLNEPLIAVLNLPAHASAEHPVPACLIVHGSGGLFSEGDVGAACDTSPENMSENFNEVVILLDDIGVATVAPSSFVSRDARFCEDNDSNYFQFVAPPFHNQGDGIPARDDFYKMRRIIVRTLDVFAAYNYMCSLDEVDCNNTCMAGTSNGGSTIMSYIANGIGNHIREYTDITQQREHESNSNFDDRKTAFQNFPVLPLDIDDSLDNKVEPAFVSAISPGCYLKKLVPTITADDGDFVPMEHMFDLNYPSGGTDLHLEIGTADDVPEHCHNGEVRAMQASDYENIMQIPAEQSQYLISTYQDGPHDLLGEDDEGPIIREKIKDLAIEHFYLIFKNGRFYRI